MNCELAHHDRGATTTEYAFLVGLIALVVITSIGLLGDSLLTIFTNAAAPFAP